jgi:hypothetical protein
MRGFYFKNGWRFRDIFREIEAFLSKCGGFSKIIARLFKYIFSGLEAFSKLCEAFHKI